MPPPTEPPAGVINLFKPAGCSSAQYVYRLRRPMGIRKVGHAGTLDPFADGVLLACVGKATKLVERLMELPKAYRTTLRLGVTNATLDPEQPFEPVAGATDPGLSAIQSAIAPMIGDVEQTPPQYSAVKIDGRRAYQLAERGIEATPKPRRVRIDAITIVNFDWPMLTLDIDCGRGTYIRSIARDIGTALKCGAVCQTLRRTRVGPFAADDGIDLNIASDDTIRAALIPIGDVLQLLPNSP